MNKNKNTIIIIISILIVLLSLKIYYMNKDNYLKKEENITINEETFKTDLLENLILDFGDKSKKRDVELSDFNLIKYDNKTYFYANVENREETSYMINYEGLEVSGIYAKIGNIYEKDLSFIEKIVIILIEVSDKKILEEEARKIYITLLDSLNEDDIKVFMEYKNGIVYGIEIEKNGGIIFYAK